MTNGKSGVICLLLLTAAGGESGLDRYIDTRRPLEKRKAEVAALGERGDALALETLMALGNTDAYVKVLAIEALGKAGGNVPGLAKSNAAAQNVGAYLRRKLKDPEPGVVCTAISSLVRIEGIAALADTDQFLLDNRKRIDNFQGVVLPAGVKALGELGDPRCVPILQREIDEVVKPKYDYEYGSVIVEALGRTSCPAGRSALRIYGTWLESQMVGKEATVQAYLQAKIDEVPAAAGDAM
ncbi:MAG: hypothetical protein GF344_16065 [Chitinivibrionales bacterium]|nr:hypothetical protein [Chitinivibrionales bacterium]MBD3358211.1 hypothetical protein [Chitinivibrionales bacterium]